MVKELAEILARFTTTRKIYNTTCLIFLTKNRLSQELHRQKSLLRKIYNTTCLIFLTKFRP